jgi:phospholipid/cholesterol/gamma-HCH transport system substrate-binding protein
MTARLAIAGALLAAAALVLVLRGGEDTTRVTAVFADVRGLVEGAEVKAGGVRIGSVSRVRLGRDGRPRVTMRVQRSFGLTRGARATVRLASLSGEFNRYVALTRGTGAPLPDGAVLGLRRTTSPVEVDDALSAFGPATRRDVHAALRGLRAATDGRGPALSLTLRSSARALRETALAAGDVAADGAALRSLVRSTRTVTRALADRPARLAGTVRELDGVLRTTAARERELRATLAALPAGLREPRRALERASAVLPDVRRLLRTAAPGARELVPAARELAPALQAARPALRSARGLADGAPASLRALTPLLREARPLAGTLDPVLRRAGPMLDHARVRLPDFFSFFSNWADFTGSYDANGHGARVGIVLPPASTRTLAPDADRAGQLAPPYLRVPGSLAGEPWRDYADSFVSGGAAAADVARPAGGRR